MHFVQFFSCRVILPGLVFCVGMQSYHATAQVNNSGKLYIGTGANMYINAAFTNAATSTYQNNGTLYLTGNFTNNQASMNAGTGTSNFMGTPAQSINGTAAPNFYNLTNNNTAGLTPSLDINIAGNWLNNGVFTHTSNAIFNGTAAQSIGGSSNTTFYNFINTNTTAAVSMNKNVTVDNIAFLNASSILSIGSNTLRYNGTVTGTGTLTGSAGSSLYVGGTSGGKLGTIYFTPGAQTLSSFTLNRINGSFVNPGRVVLGSSLTATSITLDSGILITGNNLFTWANSGGGSVLTTPASYTASFVATCDSLGVPIPEFPNVAFTGNIGFRINNVGATNTFFPVSATWLPALTGASPSPNRMMINNMYSSPENFTVVVNKGDIGGTSGRRVNRIWYVKASLDTAVMNMRLYFTQRDPSLWLSQQDEIESAFMYTDVRIVQRDYSTDPNFISISSGADVKSYTYNPGQEVYAEYTVGNSVDYQGHTNGITEINRFTVVNKGNIILPVTITALKAALVNNTVAVSWTSVMEQNIDHYEIERSANAIGFNSIGSQKALNNGSIKTDYHFTDFHPYSGDNYYRIRVVEKDGHVSYTNIVLVQTVNGKIIVTVAPNPVKNKRVIVTVSNAPSGKYNLILFGANGQKTWQGNIMHTEGSRSYTVNLPPSLAPGVYFMHVENTPVQTVTKLFVE